MVGNLIFMYLHELAESFVGKDEVADDFTGALKREDCEPNLVDVFTQTELTFLLSDVFKADKIP